RSVIRAPLYGCGAHLWPQAFDSSPDPAAGSDRGFVPGRHGRVAWVPDRYSGARFPGAGRRINLGHDRGITTGRASFGRRSDEVPNEYWCVVRRPTEVSSMWLKGLI